MLRIFAILMILPVIARAESAEDPGVTIRGKQQWESMLKAEAPYIAKARATYPSARKRFLAGLPSGYAFAVRKHLTDPTSSKDSLRLEGVYVWVEAIKNGKIYGRIDKVEMRSFREGQQISFPESEIEDWAIFHPDGTVEGDVVVKFLKSARSAYTNDLALSSEEIAKLKRVCHDVIGLPFEGAALWRGVQPFYRSEKDFFQPGVTCAGEYCSGGLRLRDASEVLFTYLHVDYRSGDLTPDVGRKGNNRIVAVSLIRHGKIIFSEGHLDQKTIDLYLRHRDSKKKSK